MKTLASLFALSAIAVIGLVIWLANPVRAGGNNFDMNRRGPTFVSFQCTIFSGQPRRETIFGIDAGRARRSLPGECTVGATCGGCADALLNDGFMLDKAFDVTQANSSYGGPYFVFIRQ